MKYFYIALVFLGLMSQPVYASEKIDTILHNRVGGLASRALDIVEQQLGDRHGKRIIVDNCAASMEYIRNSGKPILGIGYADMQFDKENNPCAQKFEEFYGFLGATPIFLCVKEDNAENAIERFTNGSVRIGHSDYPLETLKINKFVEQVNPQATVVPYENSKSFRVALAANEIDFIITPTPLGNEYCPIVLSEKLEGNATIRGIDILPNLQYSIFLHTLYLFGSNLPHNNDIVNEIMNSEAWKNSTVKNYTKFMENETLEKQYDYLNNILIK